MLILLPMDSDDTQEGKLVPVLEAKKWAVLNVEEGQIVEINYYDTKEEITDWIEVVVVTGNYEPVQDFMEKQIMVLVAHTQRSIDDVFEAFLFKELHDIEHLKPFRQHRMALALYPGEHKVFEPSDALKIQEIPNYNVPFRALPRDNDIVIIRDVFHKHSQAERILKSIYTTLANTGDIIIITKSEDADVEAQKAILERLEFRSANSIDILDGYCLVMAKKMHMWGNGL
jgi:desulfoferrodoxin (superoxide reductase-like protein)